MVYINRLNCWRLLPVYVISLIYLLQCSIVGVSAISVMSVDFGSEWMKVAIVSPGVPMEIALNKESKRKTPVAVAFRDGERTFGEDAQNVGVRFPKNCYTYLLELLGKDVNNPLVDLYKERFPYYEIIPHKTRNTVVFKHDEETEYSVEELVGMILHKAKEMAELAAGQKITDAVITVPGYFNQAERKAMLQSAQLAGINVLQLINDYTAVALNHGIFRRKDFNETAQYIMLYDMGASSTTATVISYQTAKTKERGIVETNPQLSILGVGYDRTLGGLDMQRRLQWFFGTKFNEMKKTKNDVLKNPRSMAKLFKEAGRVKNVLSANADHFAQVEGLIDEIDFRLQVTREEYENMVSDLLERVRKPLDEALKNSHLTLDIISQIILVGAGTRMPAVQASLAAATGKELGKSLNTDEAAVLGAAYKAADLSKGFKVKKFITKDAVIFPIQVSFEREGDSGTKKEVKRMLFGLMNPYPQKKIMTFNKHTTDFEISVSYSDMEHLSPEEIQRVGPLKISQVDLNGVEKALAKHSDDGSQYKGVKAHFQMDDSGLLTLLNAELIVEKASASEGDEESTLSKLGSTLTKFFSGSEEAAPNQTKEETSGETEGEKTGEGEKKTNDSDTGKAKETNSTKESTGKPKDKEQVKPQIVVVKEDIVLKQKLLSVPSMEDADITVSVNKLSDLNAYDEAKTRREGALNSLESFVFDAQNKLNTDEYKKAATQTELDSILAKCTQLAAWLEDEGWESEVGPVEEKLGELKKLTDPLWKRVVEHRERPEALAALAGTINGSAHFLAGIKNMTEHRPDSADPMFTQVEVDTLERTIKEISEWKEKSEKEQRQVPLSETPKLTIRSILDKMSQLDREVKYLVNKAKIWRPKTKEPAPAKEPDSNPEPDNKTEKVIEPEGTPETPKSEGEAKKPPAPESGDESKPTEESKQSSDSTTSEQTEQQQTQPQSDDKETDVHTEL